MSQTLVTEGSAIVAPDLLSPAFKADPYPFYARLRAEAPVFQVSVHVPERRPAWLVTRYTDAAAVLKDGRLVKDRRNANGLDSRPQWAPGFLRPLQRNMLDLDAPDHARLRGLVHKAFTPRLIERLRVRI